MSARQRDAKGGGAAVGGLGLGARFALATGLALAVTGTASAFLIFQGATRALEGQDERLVEALVERNVDAFGPGWSNPARAAAAVAEAGEAAPEADRRLTQTWQRRDARFEERDPRNRVHSVTLPDGEVARIWERRRPGEEGASSVVVVPELERTSRDDLLQLVVAVTAVTVLVGVVVAFVVASRVARPLQDVVAGVRQIGFGNLRYRSRARGGREIALLERAIDRMAHELEEARETELELSAREREVELASRVREALVPMATPLVAGFDIGAFHLASSTLGGGFHEFLEHTDGRVGLLVCDVSGAGMPAALIGATARSYLRSFLLDNTDVAAALARANRELSRDVRRGLFVTALYAEVDPGGGEARVACAGHRLPLLRCSAADEKLRVFQPEGIAIGLDRGPVFERSLVVQKLEVAPGDRLVLASSSAAELAGPDGEELGEKRFYARVLRHATKPTTPFLKALRTELEQFHGDEAFPTELSVVTLVREAAPQAS